mmetsp:Transcript_25029/g.32326  ORF Transcript_25029/g.32326 Transcript_25029/m.32326 type:complete len:411 (-) Transcript_25029:299-1531(-)
MPISPSSVSNHGNHPFVMTFRMVIISFLLEISVSGVGIFLLLSQLSTVWQDDPPSAFLPIAVCVLITGGLLCLRSVLVIVQRWKTNTEPQVNGGMNFLYLNLCLLVLSCLVVVGFLASGYAKCHKNLSECAVEYSCAPDDDFDLEPPIPCCWRNQVGDGECDANCNSTRFSFDDGDCLFCAPGCALSHLDDTFCDSKCNNAQCSYDEGDCTGGNRGLLNNRNLASWRRDAQALRERIERFLELEASQDNSSSTNSTSSDLSEDSSEQHNNGLERVFCEDLAYYGGSYAQHQRYHWDEDCCITEQYEDMCSVLIGMTGVTIALGFFITLAHVKPLVLFCCRHSLVDPQIVSEFRRSAGNPGRHGSRLALTSTPANNQVVDIDLQVMEGIDEQADDFIETPPSSRPTVRFDI